MGVSPRRGRFWRWFDVTVVHMSRVLSLVPLALLLLVLSHALHVRAFLGRWPVVYRDEPQSFLLNAHGAAIIVAFVATYFGLPMWLLAVVVRLARRRLPVRELVTQAVCIAAGIGGILVFAAMDRTGYFEWFID